MALQCTSLVALCREGRGVLEIASILSTARESSESVRRLIEERDERGASPLFVACEHGNADLVQLLLESGADPCSETNSGSFPLYSCASGGHMRCCELLLSHDAVCVNKANRNGATALYAAAQNGHYEVVRCLVERWGADVDAELIHGGTALFAACYHGHEAIVRYLHGRGASIERRYYDGSTPLLVSAAHGHVAVLELLISLGASAEARDHNGEGLWDKAYSSGSDVSVALLEQFCRKEWRCRTDLPLPRLVTWCLDTATYNLLERLRCAVFCCVVRQIVVPCCVWASIAEKCSLARCEVAVALVGVILSKRPPRTGNEFKTRLVECRSRTYQLVAPPHLSSARSLRPSICSAM